jgi:hypothetical protein
MNPISTARSPLFRAAALICLWLNLAPAQFETSSVVGTVFDPSGAVIARATVRLRNSATGIALMTVTGAEGSYVFVSVPIGRYEISAEQEGFQTRKAEAFDLRVSSRQRVDLTLEIERASESVEITASISVLESESSERSSLVDGRQVAELPLNGRQYSQLTLLGPGVNHTSLSDGGPTTAREGTFSVNGLRSTFNNFLLDGLDNNYYGTSNQGFSNQVVQLPPDAVAEFRIATNNVSAEYGRSAGGVINASMRSGTNDVHGSAWHFFRNTSLNAAGFFRPPGNRKPQLNRNQFGSTLGGPIRRNRTFFFASYEGYREVASQVQYANLPDQNLRNGVIGFRVLPGGANYPLSNPFTGAIYANGIIPAADISSYARRILAELPLPTNAASPLVNNYSRLVGLENHRDKGDLKLDHQFRDTVRGFVRYSQSRADLFDPGVIPGLAGGDGNGFTRIPVIQTAGGLTWAPSAATLIEARMGYSRARAGKDPVLAGGASMQDLLGVPGLPADPKLTGGITSIVIPGVYPPTFLGRQPTNPQYQHPSVWNPKVNLSRIIRRHTLKAGVEGQWINVEQLDVNPILGRDIYLGLFSEFPGFPVSAATNPTFTALVSFSDFLLGARSSYQVTNPLVVNGRVRMGFGYLQDDWKVSNRLTVNAGVRYEFATPYFERDNLLSNWDPAGNRMVMAKPGSIADRALVDPDLDNFAPRLGAAFTVTPKLVVRGGYGLSYVHWNRTGSQYLSLNGPQVVWATVNQRPGQPGYRLAQEGYPIDLTAPASFDPLNATVQYVPRDIRTPIVGSWFVALQREIGRDWLLDAAWVGNSASDLLTFNDVNQARPNFVGERLPVQPRRPNQAFASIVGQLPLGFSNYQGLQITLEKRYTVGLYLRTSFTWSKAIDNAGQVLEGGLTESAVQDVHNPRNDKGPSSFDRTLNNVSSFVWELPVGRGRRWLGRMPAPAEAFLGGWQLTGIPNWRSGTPFSLLYEPTPLGELVPILPILGRNPYRPNILGNAVIPESARTIDHWLDRSVVSIPAYTSPLGNSGRNSLRGPGFAQLDLGVFKNFRMGEARSVQFRCELFNATNHTNLGLPNNNASSPGFGTIRTTASEPRRFQLALKLLL